MLIIESFHLTSFSLDDDWLQFNFDRLLGTEVERLTLYRAVRSTEMAKRFYSLPSPGKEDVEFDLVELERVNIGEPFAVTVNIKNKSDETRTIQAILSAGSVYYTGVKANLVKRASGDFVLQPNASENFFLLNARGGSRWVLREWMLRINVRAKTIVCQGVDNSWIVINRSWMITMSLMNLKKLKNIF